MAKGLVDAALQFARDGYEIFPAPPNEKKSYKSAGKSNGHRWGSTSDVDTIKLDWKKWPHANIGLPTGSINNVWVLEIDTAEGHGVDGFASLHGLEQRYGKLPKTRIAISPSGSKHYYFTVPGDGRTVKNSSSELGPGIDVRGEGGMVIAPPSVRKTASGGRGAYKWRNRSCPIARAPEWLLELVCVTRGRVAERPRANGASDDNPFSAYGESVVHKPQLDLYISAMKALPNLPAFGRDFWADLAMACKYEGVPFEVFDEWSQKWSGANSKEYDSDKTEKLWRGLHPRGDITGGKIIWLADVHARGWRDKGRTDAYSIEEFYAHGPSNKFIYVPARDFWVGPTLNARLPKIRVEGEKKGMPPTTWLTKNRMVGQITWAPGKPQLIEDEMVNEGGWYAHKGARCFNNYLPPTVLQGNAKNAKRWLDHVKRIYPNDWQHIVAWMAFCVQHPEIKINHALVLMGGQGIGKDMILEPMRRAVGVWNFKETSPEAMLRPFTPFLKSVVLRVNEVRDLGDNNKYTLYNRMKTFLVTPPLTLSCEDKHVPAYPINNIVKVVMTSNLKESLFLEPDDRRHYCAWSDATLNDFGAEYFVDLWNYIENGGDIDVGTYLREYDLKDFKHGEPPPKTETLMYIIRSGRSPQVAEINDVLEHLGNPEAFTIEQLTAASDIQPSLASWLVEPKNRKAISYAIIDCGYSDFSNPRANSGRWSVNGKKTTIYVKNGLTKSNKDLAVKRLMAAG